MRKIVRKKHKFIEISILNLIDVIFILLVFFMLTTTFKKYWHFDIELPKQSSNINQLNDTKTTEIMLNLDKQILLKVNKDFIVVRKQELLNYLKNQKEVMLNADKNLSYDDVIEMIALLKQSDIKTIKLNIEK